MKIATLNIDWALKGQRKIEMFLRKTDFDFLILTEAIDLGLPNYNHKYRSEQIPENRIYEDLNYSQYLNGNKAFRTIIYSKRPFVKKHEVVDDKTCLAIEFETDIGNVIIYTTIVGTWFKKLPYAKTELENCISDCETLYTKKRNLIVVGDLNTSFIETEKSYTINIETTKLLKTLFQKLNLKIATETIETNIDHIVIPDSIQSESGVFVEKDILSDHKGVFVRF